MTTTATGEETRVEPALSTLEDYLSWVETLVADGADLQPLVNMLLQEKFQNQAALEQVRAHQAALRDQIEALCAPEQYPVVVTAVHATGAGRSVEVAGHGGRLRVAVHPHVRPDSLRVGARGLLSQKRNCLLHVYDGRGEWADVGTFEEYLPGRDRVLLRHQEQLIAVGVAEPMRSVELKKGDLVGFDREGSRLLFSKVAPPGRQDLFFEKTPEDRFEDLGGLDEEIRRLKWVVEFRLRHEHLAARYKLKAKRGILLEGPPGNGKTKLARCLARFIAGLVPAGDCHFMAIAGSSDYSMWLGQSEQKLIARFDAARDLAGRSNVPVVMFFDEIDAIGRRRGADVGSSAPDRILATLLAQLDGVQQAGNLIVVGATNRADVLDPGLLRPGRLGDVKVRIPSPNRAASAAILYRYLRDRPLVGEADALVQVLLAKLYAERGEYAEVARVALRDGTRIAVRGRDLVSGAVLENLVRVAAEDAADREARGGPGGVGEDDLVAALEGEMRGAVGLLTPGNVRGYVTRLPSDREPVGVENLLVGPGASRYVRGEGATA
jgi:proteasome-associated ATPase